MIPDFSASGLLPSGIYIATFDEIHQRFGFNLHRERLIAGLSKAISSLSFSGCKILYIDGSFVTNKDFPSDYDCCWDIGGVEVSKLDPVFLDFSNKRAAQKIKFLGEFFPANNQADVYGNTFLDFFQIDKITGSPKGIISLNI